jgi:hypothetical protein
LLELRGDCRAIDNVAKGSVSADISDHVFFHRCFSLLK